MQDYKEAIIKMVTYNMGLNSGESLLVATDVPGVEQWRGEPELLNKMLIRADFVRRVYAILKQELPQNKVEFVPFITSGQHGSEPSEQLAQAIKEYDVSLLLTSFSISHTNAREEATKLGRRIASMPGIEEQMFSENGPMAADYDRVAVICKRFADFITNGSEAHVVTDYGTDLHFSIAGRVGTTDDGFYNKNGLWGNLPAGEAFTAPVEGTANGIMVARAGWYPNLEEDMVFNFAEGLVTSIEGGGKVGDSFRELLFADDLHIHRRNCAELGIGANQKASKADNVLEAEKILGTVHIAIGDSSHVGGVNESDLHEDFVQNEVKLYIDGRLIPLYD